MESLAEQVIGAYLVQGGEVFIAPSYNIGNGWSCPDFVALDFSKAEIVVVEVTTAYEIGALIEKVRKCEEQWFIPLRARFKEFKIAENWNMRFLGFVRRDRLEKAKSAFASAPKVTFAVIEDCAFSWENWERRKGGLPR